MWCWESQKDGGTTEEADTDTEAWAEQQAGSEGHTGNLLSQDATGINSLSGWREGWELKGWVHPVQVPSDPSA